VPVVEAVTTVPWLWLAEISPATRPEWIERHTAWLSATERARLQRIVRPERRAQFLAGHVLLRRLVAARSGVDAHEVVVLSLPDGRPELQAPVAWRPSLAHSKKWVAALLVSDPVNAGIDIEFMQPARQIEAIVRLACSIETGSREDAYLIWAQREAEIKAGGRPDATWVTTWSGHALAACSKAPPEAELVDLAVDQPPVPLALIWTDRAPISPALLA
jgi:4'-phosphopantetheinyl transferase